MSLFGWDAKSASSSVRRGRQDDVAAFNHRADQPDGSRQLEGTTLFDAAKRIKIAASAAANRHDLSGRLPGSPSERGCQHSLRTQGMAARAGNGRLTEVAGLCGVQHLLERRPETLSGGERQRVGLARALRPGPGCYCVMSRSRPWTWRTATRCSNGFAPFSDADEIPMLYVTHSPAEAIALGSRLFLLEEGRIVAEGPPLDVLGAARSTSPAEPAGRASATSSPRASWTTRRSRSDSPQARRRPRAHRPFSRPLPGTRS